MTCCLRGLNETRLIRLSIVPFALLSRRLTVCLFVPGKRESQANTSGRLWGTKQKTKKSIQSYDINTDGDDLVICDVILPHDAFMGSRFKAALWLAKAETHGCFRSNLGVMCCVIFVRPPPLWDLSAKVPAFIKIAAIFITADAPALSICARS